VKGTSTDGGGSNDSDFTLSVNPGTLTIPIAGSATIDVTVARTGTTVGDITLSVDGLGSTLTADVAGSPIAEGTTTAQITIKAVGGQQPGSATVTITGTGGGKTHTADVTVTTTAITVTGKVRDGRSGVVVGLTGKQTIMSGAGGTFTFTDVIPPYDIYTHANGGCGNTNTPTVFWYEDLTRTDPIVNAATHAASCFFVFPLCLSPAPNSNVSGSKSGAGNNTDPVVWAWSEGSFNSPQLNTNGTFSGNISWCAGNTSTGSIHALQLTRKANGAPNTFLGFAKSNQTTLTSGSPAGINLVFSAVASTGTITGTLNGPPGGPTPTVQIIQQFGNVTSYLWNTSTTAIDAAFPIIASAGGSAMYASTSQTGVGQSFFVHPLTATATLNFTMPAPAVLLTPADAATGVNAQTSFTFTPASGAVSFISLGAGSAAYRIYTTKDNFTIPAVPELTLPAATNMTWSITSFTPTTSINDAAVTTELEYVSQNDYVGPPHAYSQSVSRAFTTQ
jgi:hypothetical protein